MSYPLYGNVIADFSNSTALGGTLTISNSCRTSVLNNRASLAFAVADISYGALKNGLFSNNVDSADARITAVIDTVSPTIGTALSVSVSPNHANPPVEALRVRSNGNVGIGTTSPDSRLHVFISNSGTIASFVGNGVGGSNYNFDFCASIASGIPSNRIACIDDGAWSGHYGFYSKTPGGGAGPGNPLVERMRMASNGNVGIGTQTPQFPLDVNGNIRLGTGTTGNIRFGTSGVGTTQAGYIDLLNNTMTVMNQQNGNIIFGTNNGEDMRILSNGNVGIGTQNPQFPLDVSGTVSINIYSAFTSYVHMMNSRPGIYLSNTNQLGSTIGSFIPLSLFVGYVSNASYLNIYKYRHTQGTDWTTCSTRIQQTIDSTNMGYIEFNPPNATNGIGIYGGSSNNSYLTGNGITVRLDGRVGIVTTSTDTAVLTLNGTGGTNIKMINMTTTGGGRWEILIENSANSNLYFHANTGIPNFNTFAMVAWIENDTANPSTAKMNFTGQHRCSYDETIDAINYEGLIVNSTGEYWSLINNYDNTSQIDHITINESLPKITLTKTSLCKSVFGVISFTEDTNNTRKFDSAGRFVSIWQNPLGEKKRVYVNSLGEGGIWVCNANGIFTNGDYITSSNVPGYGMVQDNGQMMNYTVGKITMDCDFNPQEFPVYKIITNSDGTKDTIISTNSSGDIITKPAYKIRYILPDGSVITKEEYDVKTANNEPVYIAAFVGCTYHCG